MTFDKIIGLILSLLLVLLFFSMIIYKKPLKYDAAVMHPAALRIDD